MIDIDIISKSVSVARRVLTQRQFCQRSPRSDLKRQVFEEVAPSKRTTTRRRVAKLAICHQLLIHKRSPREFSLCVVHLVVKTD